MRTVTQRDLPFGPRDELITEAIITALSAVRETGGTPEQRPLDADEAATYLAHYLRETLRRHLDGVPRAERTHTQVDIANRLHAEVVANGREPMWTDTHGRFDLDRVPEGVPLHLTIRAFGYLPIDTTFVPDDAERHDFELEPDAFAEAMMEVQVRRLADRAREVGVTRFVADTLPENSRMLAVFHHAGVPCRSSHSDGVVHLELLLDEQG